MIFDRAEKAQLDSLVFNASRLTGRIDGLIVHLKSGSLMRADLTLINEAIRLSASRFYCGFCQSPN